MSTVDGADRKEWIREYDGYRPEPIWKRDDNDSSHYDAVIDRQCEIPLPPIEELEKMIGL